MSRPEDKTLNTLRILSPRCACGNQGSIATPGGISVGGNIICQQELAAGSLISLGLAKFACDVSVGGIVFCPQLYSVNDEILQLKRCMVPGPINSAELATLGTVVEPWPIIYAQTICTDQINTNVMEVPILKVGENCQEQPTIYADGDQVNITANLNIVEPISNTILMKTNGYSVETYGPMYNQWNSFKCMKVDYMKGQVIYITASNIFLDIGEHTQIDLEYDADRVPDNTKVKFYFVKCQQLAKAKYNLTITRNGRNYSFASVNHVKKIKLIFVGDCVYLGS